MSETTELTYAGVSQHNITISLLQLIKFIRTLDVPGVEILKQGVDELKVQGGYIERILTANTNEELETAVTTYPEGKDRTFTQLASALPEVLQTYAALFGQDQDPKCKDAFIILRDLRSWGGMPTTAVTTYNGYDAAAQKVMEFKMDMLNATKGVLAVMPPYRPQLQDKYYVHPKKNVTREELGAEIDKTIATLRADKTTGLSSEFNGHAKQGSISVVSGSKRAMEILEKALAEKGLTHADSFEAIPPATGPVYNNGLTHNWTTTYSMLKR